MNRRRQIFCACVALLACAGFARAADNAVKLTDTGKKVVVEIGGKPFTEYLYTAEKGLPWARPYFYPVKASDGVDITSDQSRSNAKEHPHHRSLWVSHGAVNGVDHWSHGKTDTPPQQRHVKFDKVEGDTIIEQLSWDGPDGKPMLNETRTWRFIAYPDGNRGVDLTSTFTPVGGPATFEDTKEAGLCSVRLNKAISDTCVITMSTGVKSTKNADKAKKEPGDENLVWGKKAAWCDESGKIDGKEYGACVFDHPSNPRHPTNWHVRRYGLLSPNPFGLHDFDTKNTPKGAGDFKIEAGKPVTFKYRVVIHTGDAEAAKLKEKFAEYGGAGAQ
jgi:hypothetical protein